MISRRGFLGVISTVSASDLLAPRLARGATRSAPAGLRFGNAHIRVSVEGTKSLLWKLEYLDDARTYLFAPPSFPLQGAAGDATLKDLRTTTPPRKLTNGVVEYSFEGVFLSHSNCKLVLTFQVAPENPLVRFRYSLQSLDEPFTFSNKNGQLVYFSTSLAGLGCVTEVQLSDWNGLLHSNTVSEFDVSPPLFADRSTVAGPILIATADEKSALLLAFEHGSQMPDRFLEYQLQPDRSVQLTAVKGNYVPSLAMRNFDTVWMEASVATTGRAGLKRQFRAFVHQAMDTRGGSRFPYLFYNTWNFQERDKWWHHQQYLSRFNNEKMLAELEVAHRLQLDMFVMDTGWYNRTGDWEVDETRFPDGLQALKQKLSEYGMKLGLWNNPALAAVSSKVLVTHRKDVCTLHGQMAGPHDVWESEASYSMCLVSGYSDTYAETLIRVARETGARYISWDAVPQYACDSPDHWHGTSANSRQERADCYAYQLPIQMVRIVEKVRDAFPEMIFDFDITETGRAVGLAFLSAGRFFLTNNGPYLADYDLPHQDGAQNDNLFFYPGQARAWICRQPLNYDQWIPSNLLIAHYLPDDPASSRLVNMATLVLGQNGIWGDLATVSQAGIDWCGQLLGRYKEVRHDVQISDPIVRGQVSGSYEAHEKINPANGRGVVVLFSATRSRMVYVTAHKPAQLWWSTDGSGSVNVSVDARGHAVIESEMQSAAAIVLFGVA